MKEISPHSSDMAQHRDYRALIDSEWQLNPLLRLKRWRAGFVALGCLIVLSLAALSVRQAEELARSRDWVVHSYQILTELDMLLALTTNAEAVERGYVITGRNEYLKPFHDARANLPKHISELKKLTRDNSAQQKRIPPLESMLEQKLDDGQKTIDLRRHGQLAAAKQIIAANVGERSTDRISGMINKMKAEEQRLLLTRIELVRTSLLRFHLYLYALVCCVAVGIALFLYLLMRYWQHSITFQHQQRVAESVEQGRLFKKMFDLMPQLAWTARPDGFIDFYNKGWYEYTGTTYEQMKGWGWHSVHDPKRLPEVMERWRYSLKTGTPFLMEFPLRRKDGVFRRFTTRANPMFDEDGNIVRWVGINTDIDEQTAELKTINARLKESEERLDLCLNSSELGVWDLDIKSGTVWHSLKHDQIFGYSHLQPVWTYDIFLSHVIPEDRDRVKQMMEHAYETGTYSIECRIARDHATAWIAAQGRVYRDEHGRPSRMMGTIMDITKRKEAEISKEHLASIVATSSTAIIGKTLDGIITSWNKGAERIYGYLESEVIGKPISILIPPGNFNELPEILSKISQGELIDDYETSRIRKDGTLIDVHLTISPIKNPEGSIIGASTVIHDVSETRRAEAALREAKDFTEALFRFAPDAIFIVDQQGSIFSLNAQAEMLTGYTNGELLGQPIEFLIPIRFRERHIEHRQRYVQNPEKRVMGSSRELYALRKDGREFPVDIMLSPIQTDKANMTMAVVRDLTEQKKFEMEKKQAEQILWEQDAMLSRPRLDTSLVHLFKKAATVLAVTTMLMAAVILVGCIFQIDALRNPTPWGTFTKANAAFCLFLGSISLLMSLRPNSITRSISFVIAGIIVAVGVITICEWMFGWDAGIDQLIAPDTLIRERFAPGRMPNSPAVAFVFLGISLWTLNTRKTVISQMCAFVVFSIGLITLTGHAYGFSPLLTFGTSTLVAFPTSIGLLMIGAALFWIHVDAGIAYVIVSPSLGGRVTRRVVPLMFLVPAIGAIGGMGKSSPVELLVLTTVTTILFPAIAWLVGRTIDRLDRQKDQAFERAFARKEELEVLTQYLSEARDQALQASNLKSAFVANISHELRTPLSGIIGANDLLAQQDLKPEGRELIGSAQESAKALNALVDDLLDLSRIEAGKFAIMQDSFNLADIVTESVNLCAGAAEAKNLTLTATVDSRLPLIVIGDAARIRQVLLNLLNNAIKFTPKGGIHLGVTPELEREGEALVKFAVTDTGIGISEEDQGALFLPFSQVDSSETRQYGGAGLGLALCKNLVELMNGSIGVESRKGEGSVFWFIVPLRLSPIATLEQEHTGPLKAQDRFSDKAVLVVEDNAVIQKLVLKQLLSLGTQASAASTGMEALNAVFNAHFDLILMDCNLPDRTGFDVTQEIRKMEAGGNTHTPIVALTAAAMQGDREKCLASGMDDYLSKPVKIQQLQQMLEKWLAPRIDD